jgi:hypothetical protein
VVAIWEQAFSVIAALHEAAFSDKPLYEALNSIDDYIEAWLLSGATSKEDFDTWRNKRGTDAMDAVAGLDLPTMTNK